MPSRLKIDNILKRRAQTKSALRSAIDDGIVYDIYHHARRLGARYMNRTSRWFASLTPLYYALSVGCDENVLRTLLAAKAKVNVPVKPHDHTAVYYAAVGGRKSNVRYLVLNYLRATGFNRQQCLESQACAKQLGHTGVLIYLQGFRFDETGKELKGGKWEDIRSLYASVSANCAPNSKNNVHKVVNGGQGTNSRHCTAVQMMGTDDSSDDTTTERELKGCDESKDDVLEDSESEDEAKSLDAPSGEETDEDDDDDEEEEQEKEEDCHVGTNDADGGDDDDQEVEEDAGEEESVPLVHPSIVKNVSAGSSTVEYGKVRVRKKSLNDPTLRVHTHFLTLLCCFLLCAQEKGDSYCAT